MAEQIKETDTLNQGRVKINAAIDLANESAEKVDDYKTTLDKGVADAKKIASDAGDAAKQIATDAGAQANVKADQAVDDSATAVNIANQAISRANQNKQEFDALENEFQDLVAESGDSNPEIVQARTDTQGIKQTTLQARLTKDFSERMTTADAVQMFSGPINTPKMMDFAGKTAGNTSSNPHAAYSDYTATSLKKPSASWNEMSQDNYNKLAGRDDSGVSTGSTQNGIIPQQRGYFNLLETVKQLAPNIFNGLSVEESVKYIKDNFVSFSLSIRAKASSPNNKVLKVAAFLESTDSYSTQIQETALEYEDFKIDINDSNFINSAGELNILIYSDSSNGVTSSLIDVDYFGVQLTISLNPLSVLESSGFAKKTDITKQNAGLGNVENVKQATKTEFDSHVSNKQNPHGVTKTQIGLGNVPNYAAATDEEAIAGSSDSTLMTPAKTKLVTDQAMESVMIGTISKRYDSTFMQFAKNTSYVTLTRFGDLVFFYCFWSTLDDAKKDERKYIFTIPEGFRVTQEENLNHQVPYNTVYQNNSIIQDGRVLKDNRVDLPVAAPNSHGHTATGFWITNDGFPE